MDLVERSARSKHAESVAASLAAQGVVAFATTFVDNSGIARVKAVPLSRLPQLAGWGVGLLHGLRLLPVRRLGGRAAQRDRSGR